MRTNCLSLLFFIVAVFFSNIGRAELPEHYDAPLHPVWGAELSEYLTVEELQQIPSVWRDFSLQGEYIGKIDGQTAGLHLIANGDGQFDFVLYTDGLPGDGWRPGTIRMFGTGVVENDEIVLTTDRILSIDTVYPVQECIKTTRYRYNTTSTDEEPSQPQCDLVRTERGVIPLLKFEKVYRKSPTLGLPSPEGAEIIFDGTNVDLFIGEARVNRKRSDGVTLWAGATTKLFDKWWERPMTIHLEFMTSYRPKCHGQERANSGIFIAETYEIQILDSFGLEPEEHRCGALYHTKSVDVNVCYPPLVWQTYDIEFQPPKFLDGEKIANSVWTVKFNGVPVHANYEMVKKTPADKEEILEPRSFYFQPHENRVQFKNIWIEYH